MPQKKGFRHSEETKAKMRLSAVGKNKGRPSPMLGRNHSEKTKQKMRVAKLGMVLSEEHKDRLRKLRLGVKSGPCSESTKKKIGEANSKLFNKRIGKNGYVVITVSVYPEYRRIYEHRHVMEEHIGRKLRTDEAVHHIDWDKTNNNIKNLQLMSRSEHARMHANDHIRKGGHKDVFIKLQPQ